MTSRTNDTDRSVIKPLTEKLQFDSPAGLKWKKIDKNKNLLTAESRQTAVEREFENVQQTTLCSLSCTGIMISYQ